MLQCDAFPEGALSRVNQWLWIKHPTFELRGRHSTTELISAESDWYTRSQNKRSCAWASSLFDHETGAFKYSKAISFQTYLHSYHHLLSWILVNDWKNFIPNTNGSDGSLQRVHSVTLEDKVRSWEIRKALNVKSHLQPVERSQVSWFGQVARMSHVQLMRQVLLVKPTGKRPRCRSRIR